MPEVSQPYWGRSILLKILEYSFLVYLAAFHPMICILWWKGIIKEASISSHASKLTQANQEVLRNISEYSRSKRHLTDSNAWPGVYLKLLRNMKILECLWAR